MKAFPIEYEALCLLHSRLGDVKTAEYFCVVYNKLNLGSNLRIKSVDDKLGKIILTGICTKHEEAISILKCIISFGIEVIYEKTFLIMEPIEC